MVLPLSRSDTKAPLVSFMTYADVGVDEPEGKTGSSLLEHLAFKGTQRIGTRGIIKRNSLIVERLDDLAENSSSKAASASRRYSPAC